VYLLAPPSAKLCAIKKDADIRELLPTDQYRYKEASIEKFYRNYDHVLNGTRITG
jgi:hypothetical protein